MCFCTHTVSIVSQKRQHGECNWGQKILFVKIAWWTESAEKKPYYYQVSYLGRFILHLVHAILLLCHICIGSITATLYRCAILRFDCIHPARPSCRADWIGYTIHELFVNNIQLELLGQWFSRPTENTDASQPEDSRQVHADEIRYCYCKEGEHSEMVGCDNSDCPYQWFHLTCLHLTNPPKNKTWYCPDCRKLEKLPKRGKQRASNVKMQQVM